MTNAAKNEPGRERLLAAALDSFGERGYEGASIADIADRAGVTKSVIYHHFGSKAGLYEALLAEQTDILVTSVQAAAPQPVVDVRDATRAVIDAYLTFVETRPRAWRLLVRDAPVEPAPVATYRRFQQDRARALLALFPALAADDEDKRLYVELLAVGLRAFATWWHDRRDVPRERVVDAVMEFADATARMTAGRGR